MQSLTSHPPTHYETETFHNMSRYIYHYRAALCLNSHKWKSALSQYLARVWLTYSWAVIHSFKHGSHSLSSNSYTHLKPLFLARVEAPNTDFCSGLFCSSCVSCSCLYDPPSRFLPFGVLTFCLLFYSWICVLRVGFFIVLVWSPFFFFLPWDSCSLGGNAGCLVIRRSLVWIPTPMHVGVSLSKILKPKLLLKSSCHLAWQPLCELVNLTSVVKQFWVVSP